MCLQNFHTYIKISSLLIAQPQIQLNCQIKKNSLDQVEIFGSSGVAVAWGLHYYLKTYCNVHISWEGNQIELPQTLPDVRVKVTSNDRYEVSSKEDETTRKPQGKNMISHILYEAAIAEFTATSMKPILPNYVAIWFPDKIYSEHRQKCICQIHLLLCNLHLSFSSTLFNS